MYGSQPELLAEGVDLKQLLGLITHTDSRSERDEYSISDQDDGRCVC